LAGLAGRKSRPKNKPEDEERTTKKQKQEESTRKKKKYIRKYTGNGSLPLHEAVVIANQPLFVCYSRINGESKLQSFKAIENTNDRLLCPADTIDTQNPIPYVFSSLDELNDYLRLAKQETFDSLYSRVETIFRKYVNAEDHYIVLMAASAIYSYFQDKFGTTHYIIFVGDNSSGKNSALLTFRYLGYRVFYVVSASAPNYFTFLGDVEECQGCTAEDEAEDIAYDKDKQKLVKSGYCSGATVPKVELSPGKRAQGVWNTYCHKWFAMEEEPDYKKIKGIKDRSFVINMVVGKVPYNIKDIIGRKSGDPQHRELYDELIHMRKLLLAFRLLHYEDKIPDIKLNVIHRNEELTKRLLRLFGYRSDAPKALEKIRSSLSKFILGRNEAKKNSIEAKLFEAINNLIEKRMKNELDVRGLDDLEFTNDMIFGEVENVIGGKRMEDKDSISSIEYGVISLRRIKGLYRSKLKADGYTKRVPFIEGNDTETVAKRVLRFRRESLDSLKLYYEVPNEVKFVDDNASNTNSVTHVTHVTLPSGLGESKNIEKEGNSRLQEHGNNGENGAHTPPESATSVTSVTDQKTEYERYVEEQEEKKKKILEESELRFQPYVHRINANSDRWECDYCNYRDDKWGMAKHSHTQEEMRNGPREKS